MQLLPPGCLRAYRERSTALTGTGAAEQAPRSPGRPAEAGHTPPGPLAGVELAGLQQGSDHPGTAGGDPAPDLARPEGPGDPSEVGSAGVDPGCRGAAQGP